MIIDISDYSYPNPFFECQDKYCPYQKGCAQHETAGEHRYENGFTPELLIIGNQCHCDTYEQEPLRYNGEIIEDLPANYADLERGALHSNRIGHLVTDAYDDDGLYDFEY